MKLHLLSSVLFSIILFPTLSSASGQTCEKQMNRLVEQLGSPSDVRRELDTIFVLDVGQTFQYRPNQVYGPFDEKVVVGLVSGSYHSGYFLEVYFVGALDCQYINHEVVYSE